MTRELIKTKYAGVYYTLNSDTKIKTYIARIKIPGVINTDKVVGYSNDEFRTNPSIASERRVQLIAEYKSGKIKARTMKFENFLKEYMEHTNITQRQSTFKSNKYSYKKNFASLYNKTIDKITTMDIQKIIDNMIKEGRASQTAINQKSIIQAALEYGVKKGYINTNPAKNVYIPKKDRPRKFYLDPEKAKTLYQAICKIENIQYRTMFLLLLTGRRKGEILSLNLCDVNLNENSYIVLAEKNKNKVDAKYFFSDDIKEYLVQQKAKNSILAFPSPVTGEMMSDFPRSVWRRIQNEIGANMRLHDFRHLLGLTLVNNGVPIEVISKTLGHQNIKTTQRYSNITEEMARKGADTFMSMLKN